MEKDRNIDTKAHMVKNPQGHKAQPTRDKTKACTKVISNVEGWEIILASETLETDGKAQRIGQPVSKRFQNNDLSF